MFLRSGPASEASKVKGRNGPSLRLRCHAVRGVMALTCARALVVPSAWAEGSVTDRTQAQLLFDQGRDLMAAGSFAQACAKFAESQRLDPGGGTLLNLALCHEKEGKTATAWADFHEALSAALRDRRTEREKLARDHIAALEPELPRLVLRVDRDADDAALGVKLDGRDVARAAWGAPVPVDPAPHVVQAFAAGKQTWTTEVVLRPRETLTVRVPPLQGAGDVAKASGSTPATMREGRPDSSSSRQKTTGYVTAGFGLVSIGVGATFGILAIGEQKRADDQCRNNDRCTSDGLYHNQLAQRNAWISDGFLAVGLVAGALGTYWVLASNHQSTVPAAKAAPRLGASSFAIDVKPPLHGGASEVIVRGTW